MKGFKIGMLYDSVSDNEKLKIFDKIIPGRKAYKKCKCFFALSHDKNKHEEGIFERKGDIVYACTGHTGFKFMPVHGELV